MSDASRAHPRQILVQERSSPRISPLVTSRRLSLVAGIFGATILALLLMLALAPQILAPYDPTEIVGRPLQPPGNEFPLGTNDIGQDLLSELIWGTRNSLSIGLIVAFIAISLGALVGLISGFTSGLVSGLFLRMVDLTLVLPFLPLVILISAYLGPSQRNIILVLSLVSWAAPARLIRASVLSIKNEAYIEATLALGGSWLRLLVSHVLPGVRSIVLVQFVLVASASILAEASLSFLGLGDVSAKSWGAMLYFARASGAFLSDAWQWWVLPAGLMITLAVLSLVLIGYSLENTHRA
jgi:peptide/nickel transport system permease protein